MELGRLLRDWRDMRRKSQIDLSLDTGLSQRYLSFIESGRSVPSRQVVLDIAEALDVPLRDRNALLLAAGYAPMYAEGRWDANEMHSVTRALDRMLHQNEPYPAVVMDRYWNVLMSNQAAPRFFNCFIDMAARAGPRNLLHLLFDPLGMRPFLVNWESVARSLIQRVHREAVGRVVDEKTRALLATLCAYPDVEPEWRTPKVLSIRPPTPVIPYSFHKDGVVLNYCSIVSTVGNPTMVAAQELRIECLFPTDEETETHHARLMEV
jgi:transcriptional regulator with XRE-family HTH domain